MSSWITTHIARITHIAGCSWHRVFPHVIKVILKEEGCICWFLSVSRDINSPHSLLCLCWHPHMSFFHYILRSLNLSLGVETSSPNHHFFPDIFHSRVFPALEVPGVFDCRYIACWNHSRMILKSNAIDSILCYPLLGDEEGTACDRWYLFTLLSKSSISKATSAGNILHSCLPTLGSISWTK